MMNVIMGKSTVVILCSVTAILSLGFLIKYSRRRKKIKSNQLEDSMTPREISEPIESDAACKDDEAKLNGKEDNKDDETEEILQKFIPKEWRKIGEVKELFIYPLKSGRGKNLRESVFTEYGISYSSEEEGSFSLRDRMFVVYKQETGELRIGKNYPTLVLVTLSNTGKNHVKLEAVGMPFLKFKVPEDDPNIASVSCIIWWGETIRCIDCGSEAARWISRFLTGTNSGLRLGCCRFEGSKTEETQGKISNSEELLERWEKFDKVIANLGKEEGTMQMASKFASYLAISESSIDALNQNLNRPRSPLQFRPNLVVSGPEPFSEDDWEWIKIGENVVMRNVKPYSRTQKNARRIQIAGEPPTAGIHCGIYKTGRVKIGDDVYVNGDREIGHMREQNAQENHRDLKSASESLIREEIVLSRKNSLSNGLL